MGQVNKLETAVYQGAGDLITSLGKVWNEDARNFVKKVPEKIVSQLCQYISFNLGIFVLLETNWRNS